MESADWLSSCRILFQRQFHFKFLRHRTDLPNLHSNLDAMETQTATGLGEKAPGTN